MAEEGMCPELTALQNCYNKLTLALPLDDIAPRLISQRVISIADKQQIMAHPTDALKIDHFLEILRKPLSAGETKQFYIFLNVLKQNMKGGFLAGQLEKELEKAGGGKAFKVDAAYSDAGIPTEPITNMKVIRQLVIPKISPHWESLGASLHLDKAYIAEIKQRYAAGDNKSCCIEMIENWACSDKGVGPKTWPVLLQAIANTSAELVSVANDIKQKLIR